MIIHNNIQKSILKHLEKGPDTKSNLAALFDVSITAITSHINELKEKEFILEKNSTLHTGGRIPKILELNNKNKFTIGISFSSISVRIVLMSISKKVIDEERIEINFDTIEQHLSKAKEMMKDILAKNKVKESNVIGVGISIPGPVDPHKEVIEYVNFGFRDIPYSLIKEYLGNNIFIQNEANLALLYEKHYRNIANNHLIVQLSLNEGLGCGIYHTNSFLESNLGYAGELGSIIVDYKTKDTAEDLISYTNIIKKYNELSSSKINNIDDFFIKLKDEDKIAVELKDQMLLVINTAIHNINMILDPTLILLNGRTIREFNSMNYLDSLKCNCTKVKHFTSQTQLIFSENINTTTYGAALYALSVTFGQHEK